MESIQEEIKRVTEKVEVWQAKVDKRTRRQSIKKLAQEKEKNNIISKISRFCSKEKNPDQD